MTRSIYIIIFLLGPFLLNAQRVNRPKPKKSYAKGAIFAHWGYNRSYYSKSDINFIGSGYNFTVGGCQGEDRPEPFSFGGSFPKYGQWQRLPVSLPLTKAKTDQAEPFRSGRKPAEEKRIRAKILS